MQTQAKHIEEQLLHEENNPAVVGINYSIVATFKITDTKLQVSVVTLSTENYNKLLEQLKT